MINTKNSASLRTTLAILLGSLSMSAQEVVMVAPMTNVKSTEISSLSGECTTAQNGSQLQCRFVQAAVRLQRRPEDVEPELSRLLKDFEPADVARIKQDVEICSGAALAKISAAAKSAQSTPATRAFAAKLFEAQREICVQPTRERIAAWMRLPLERESQTCRVWTNHFETTFVRSVDGAWVSNIGPEGACGVVNVSRLERSETSSLLYKYKTQKIITAKSNELCKALDETPQEFSWDAQSKELACSFIEFGF